MSKYPLSLLFFLLALTASHAADPELPPLEGYEIPEGAPQTVPEALPATSAPSASSTAPPPSTPDSANDLNEFELDADADQAPAREQSPDVTTVKEETVVTEEQTDGQSEAQDRSRDYNPRVPLYQRIRPEWAIEITGTWSAFGGTSINVAQDGQMYGFSAKVEYQPAILQQLGVFGFGLSGNFYPSSPTQTFFRSAYTTWSAGAQARYQARFFNEQIIVPQGGFAYEFWVYSLTTGQSGQIHAMGPFFGAWFLLNSVEPGAAADFYSNHRATRSYLVGEARLLTGQDANISLSGLTYYVGLRIEFE